MSRAWMLVGVLAGVLALAACSNSIVAITMSAWAMAA